MVKGLNARGDGVADSWLKEALIYSALAIARAAKQSMPHKESITYGSPRRCTPAMTE